MNSNGTVVEGGDVSGVSSFSFNFDDNVSDITLDRRIRTESDDIDKIFRPVGDFQKEKSRISIFSDTSEQSIRARMAILLKEDKTGGLHGSLSYISTDDKDGIFAEKPQRRRSDTGEIVAKWEAPPEQGQHPDAIAASKMLKTGQRDSDPELFISPEQAPIRRESYARSRGGGSSAAKKPFLPPWKPPIGHEAPQGNIIVETIQKESSSEFKRAGSDCSALLADTGGRPSSATEIYFDSSIIPPRPDDAAAAGGQDDSADTIGDSAMYEDSGLNEDGFSEYALENSSHLDLDEYGEYSSKLLEMLDEADVRNVFNNTDEREVAQSIEGAHLRNIKLKTVLVVENSITSKDESETIEQDNDPKADDGHVSTPESSRIPSHDGVNPRSSIGIKEEINAKVPTDSNIAAAISVTASSSQVVSDDGLRSASPQDPIASQKEDNVETMAFISNPSPEAKNDPKKPPPGPKPAPMPISSTDDSTSSSKHEVTLQQETHDIILLLRELQDSRSEDHEALLSKLTELIWAEGLSAKQQFVSGEGIKILASIMWSDMMIPRAERAAADLFLAVAATSSSAVASASGPLTTASGVLVGDETTEGLVDALLITMQTLTMDEDLQQVACRVLCCLASSGNENDGTRSGACLAVLNAMDAHYTSPVIQEWGLRALYSQCVHSMHAGTNKHTLLSSRLNTSDTTGQDILEHIIIQKSVGEFHLREGGILEWACKLCWCLTVSTESAVTMVSPRLETLRALLHILEQSRTMEEASVQLQESVLGMISNLSRMDQNRSFLCTVDVIFLILDVMHANKEYVEVQIEACSVIANISSKLAPPERDQLVDNGAVRTIVGAIFAHPEAKNELHGPALRALLGLAVDSEIAKEEICERETLSVLMQNCRMDQNSTLTQQETLCNIIASLYAGDGLQQKALQCDSFGALTAAMAAYSSSMNVQDAVCVAYRNLSKNEENLDLFLRGNVVGLVVNAMMRFSLSRSIQTNACCILWNIGAGTEFGFRRISKTRAMSYIVSAIQNHLESHEVVDMACGVLWSFIHGSYDLRQQFLEIDSGVESVACTLVMHPRSTKLLEKACGVLATISIEPHPRASTVTAEGVSNVVETMKQNEESVELLQYGALFLRNAILRSQELVHEASGAIPVLIAALRHFNRADAFQRETCYFIWSIAELSHDAKSRILALDGLSVVMAILNRTSGIEIVENAALGAFKELGLTST